MTRSMMRTRPLSGCPACMAGLGATPETSSAVPKIIGAGLILGLLGAWAIWFTTTHELKPQYGRS